MHQQLARVRPGPQAPPASASPAPAADAPLTAMGRYGYAGGVVQRQAAAASAAAPAPHAAGGGSADASAGINRTGLPDGLKSGIEALSGISLDRVRVHYDSAAPARLDAHAYAQGSEIHLARGQERHLPHEAWHVVQQAQGRVAPARHARGVPVNDDPLLEREAERMGATALRTPAGRVPAGTRPTASRGVAQRMPDEALAQLSEQQRQHEIVRRLIRVLANARRLSRNYPLIGTKTQTFEAIRSVLHQQINRVVRALGRRGENFVQLWNRGNIVKPLEKYDPQDALARIQPQAPREHWSEQETEQRLQQWEGKKIADKTMNADLKLARLIPLILDEIDYPEDVELALKLFFTHTASFIPEGRLGRDFGEREDGTYFRTSPTQARKGNSELLKSDYKTQWDEFPKGQTAQVLNQALHRLLAIYGNLPSNIYNAELIGDDTNPLLSYAVYTASNKSGTGSLGLIQNVYRTLLSGSQVERRFGGNPGESWQRVLAGQRFAREVPDDMLASASKQNYHDLLLADRGRLVREVAQEIRERYGEEEEGGGWRVVPIQSSEHASLILEVKYPQDTDESEHLGEQVWRESFIAIFNRVAGEMGLQTRVTHRGSFGFLYPSVSSVGTPVRIWPGLSPDKVFKELVFGTLNALARNEYWEDGAAPFDAPKSKSKQKWRAESPPRSGVVLHREALKSAVRYAQDVMRETLTVKGPPGLVDWLSVRLRHSLLKARRLLTMPAKEDLPGQESAYLKSAGVIENLMEYSYLLEALRADAPPSDDPYPAYLRRKLGLSDDKQHSSHRTTRTFYLDSGMQAIVGAHLLARKWALDKDDSPTRDLKSIDLYTYFEYAGIDKSKLHFEAQNRGNSGYSNDEDFWRTIIDEFEEDSPTVISADLNPVFTTPEAVQNQVSYQQVLEYFAGIEGDLNLATVPIVDVTNASLDKVAELKLQQGYENFIVVESLSKHQQLGADKFTMGRLTAIGSEAFVKRAGELLEAVENSAAHRLPSAYRLRMDRVFYGDSTVSHRLLVADELMASAQYDNFMALMGLDEAWRKLDRSPQGSPEELQLRYAAMQEQLDRGFQRYVKEVGSDGIAKHDLQKAFQSLPPLEQRRLLHQLEHQFDEQEEEEVLGGNPFLAQLAIETGVTNVGSTCYLSAALNMLAFSPYSDLFQPRLFDPRAELRALIRQALEDIVAGRPVSYEQVSTILAALDHARLLEAPHAEGGHRALNAQRDPAEVLEYVLNFFGVQHADYRFSLAIHRRLDLLGARVDDDGDPESYSNVDQYGHYAPEQANDWMLKLPISGFADLAEAMHGYLAQAPTPVLTGVHGRHTDQQRLLRGSGVSQVVLGGGHAPRVISIQLIRWVFRHQRVGKDNRSFGMPHAFTLNGFVYRLRTVIYHRGQSYNVGHYTTSTRIGDSWQYRDDRWVYNNDQAIDQRKGQGYIYTYERDRALNLGDLGLLDLAYPPGPGHQGGNHEDEQPPPGNTENVDMGDSSSPRPNRGSTRNPSRKRDTSSRPSNRASRKESRRQAELKLRQQSDEQNRQSDSDSSGEASYRSASRYGRPYKKTKR